MDLLDHSIFLKSNVALYIKAIDVLFLPLIFIAQYHNLQVI